MKKIASYQLGFSQNFLICGGLLTGLVFLVTFLVRYYQLGYSNFNLSLWLFSITSFGYAFFLIRTKEVKSTLDNFDIKLIILLSILLIPFYFLFTYQFPFQMHTDEILEVILIKTLSKFDLFGLTNYDGYLQAKLWELSLVNQFIGQPLSVFNLRIVGALHAWLAVVFSYFLFRMFSSRLEAFLAALLLGFSHTWIFFSRAFYLRLPPVLLEVLALCLFYKGVVSKCPFYSFLGGLVAGLGFYIYYPARIVILEAIVFFIIVFLFYHKKYYKWELMKLFLAVMVGLIVAISPLFISTAKNNLQLDYLKRQILIFPEGLSQVQMYSGLSPIEVLKVNISNGLTFLVRNVPDQAYNYTNKQFGFVEGVTSILLLIGLLVILFDPRRRLGQILIVSSFLLIISIFAFLVSYTPNYGRLLMLFPFIGYLTMRGVIWMIGKFSWPTNSSRTKAIIISSVLICILNVAIFFEFSWTSYKKGDLLGQTMRFVDQRSLKDNYTFFIAADRDYPYLVWGGHGYHWFALLVAENQHFQELNTKQITNFHSKPPFTIFMNRTLWMEVSPMLLKNYPNLDSYFMTPDGKFLAVEVI